MAALRPPSLGPIVGHTTDRTSKIWVRASIEDDGVERSDSNCRTIGVIGISRMDGSWLEFVETFYFRLRREFDRCGCITLGTHDTPKLELTPDTRYIVRVGCLVLDDPAEDGSGCMTNELVKRLPPASVWRDDLAMLDPVRSEGVVRTFPTAAGDRGKMSFLLGSCRYPGLLWKARHADRIFHSMARFVDSDGPARFVLMVGDQVYADHFDRVIPIGRADTYRGFQKRYLTAFGSSNMRFMMQRVPTYMILDDHEIEDNWSQDRMRRSARYQLFMIAIDAYLSYQWSHGPRTYGKRLYYRFDCGSYPFFVLDTRTQRFYEGEPGDLSQNHLLGRPSHPGAPQGQLSRLLEWLRTQQSDRGNVPKFVVTSSVFVPNPMSARTPFAEQNSIALEMSDSWPAFPNTRTAILRWIVDHGIQNVIFLSGDIHCSNVAAMTFSGTTETEKLRAFSINSSALYQPFPFADGEPSDFVHDSCAEGQEDTYHFTDSKGQPVSMDYKAWNFTQKDNFTHITAERSSHTVKVRVLGTRGALVMEDAGGRKLFELDTKLDLVPW